MDGDHTGVERESERLYGLWSKKGRKREREREREKRVALWPHLAGRIKIDIEWPTLNRCHCFVPNSLPSFLFVIARHKLSELFFEANISIHLG